MQKAEMGEEEERLVMSSVKPDDAGNQTNTYCDQTIDMYCDQTYIVTSYILRSVIHILRCQDIFSWP